jgi:carboxylesterase type B
MQDPVPVKPWTGNTLDTTKEGPSCLQNEWFSGTTVGQEDCLVLNVYTHNVKLMKDFNSLIK